MICSTQPYINVHESRLTDGSPVYYVKIVIDDGIAYIDCADEHSAVVIATALRSPLVTDIRIN